MLGRSPVEQSGSATGPRIRLTSARIRAALKLTDGAAIITTAMLARELTAPADGSQSLFWFAVACATLVGLDLFAAADAYRPRHLGSLAAQVLRSVGVWLALQGVMIVFAFLTGSLQDLTLSFFLLWSAIAVPIFAALHGAVALVVAHGRRVGWLAHAPVSRRRRTAGSAFHPQGPPARSGDRDRGLVRRSPQPGAGGSRGLRRSWYARRSDPTSPESSRSIRSSSPCRIRRPAAGWTASRSCGICPSTCGSAPTCPDLESRRPRGDRARRHAAAASVRPPADRLVTAGQVGRGPRAGHARPHAGGACDARHRHAHPASPRPDRCSSGNDATASTTGRSRC